VYGAGACHGPAVKNDTLWLWPRPPERPRYQYETTLYSSKSVQAVKKKNALQRFATSRLPQLPAGNVFIKPYDVSAYHGRIYITDTALALVHVFDVPRRRFFQFGYRFEGKLRKPAGIAQDHSGMVYVADIDARRVVVYDGFGLFQRFIGIKEALHFPADVAVTNDGSRVFVVDRGGIDSKDHRIAVFDGEGKLLRYIGTRGEQNGQFNLPIAATVAGDRLYVLDAGNFRVQVFDLEGKFIRSWGKPGKLPGTFARPRGLAVGPGGEVFVCDSAFGNVQVFNPRGQLLLSMGEGQASKPNGPGNYPLLAGVGADETGRVYLVDQYFRKVEVLRPVNKPVGVNK